MLERLILKIHGIVQGVGFRPFIHRLTKEYCLNGYIKNTSSGVELELEGEPEALRSFVEDIPRKAPGLALIEKTEVQYGLEPVPFHGFEIRSSKREAFRNTLISPDICICEDCLRELKTPGDRRFRYPFVNCTNCGPRFTIIRDVPYDRACTSMDGFRMCPACDAEYHDIENRRYHAQPDCCPDCGPEIFFSRGREDRTAVFGEQALASAKRCIADGGILAVKGLGGIHLACRCDAPEIIRTLRKRKKRDARPFAVMCRDTDSAKTLCEISGEEELLLNSFRRPIVLLEKRKDGACGICPEALREISGNGYIGIMLPYTPLHYLLLEDDPGILIMTSANLSETPVICSNNDAYDLLADIADGFLLHDREIVTRCDDSLCWSVEGKEYFARRSRGYVPFPITAGLSSGKQILSCGAEQKASFSLNRENYVFQSQHIGDLKNLETYRHYLSQVAHFEKLFDIAPEAVVCDLHPDYMSTEFAVNTAEEKRIPLFRVQHHHAHLASCMADNRLQGQVIGLIWDGTGLGTDGTVWGGECLVGGYAGVERAGSILPIPLIGGDRAIQEISRIAYAMKRSVNELPEDEKKPEFDYMLSAGLNCPVSSGMGRLFDGVAAILGILETAEYEGQGAELLEAAASAETEKSYGFLLTREPTTDGGEVPFVLDWRPLIGEIVSDLRRGTGISEIAAGFMNTLVKAGTEQCLAARKSFGWNRVVLSGGVFQNMYLLSRLPARLREEGFEVYIHRRVSCNDEGVSLGQLAVADYLMTEGNSYVSCGADENRGDQRK